MLKQELHDPLTGHIRSLKQVEPIREKDQSQSFAELETAKCSMLESIYRVPQFLVRQFQLLESLCENTVDPAQSDLTMTRLLNRFKTYSSEDLRALNTDLRKKIIECGRLIARTCLEPDQHSLADIIHSSADAAFQASQLVPYNMGNFLVETLKALESPNSSLNLPLPYQRIELKTIPQHLKDPVEHLTMLYKECLDSSQDQTAQFQKIASLFLDDELGKCLRSRSESVKMWAQQLEKTLAINLISLAGTQLTQMEEPWNALATPAALSALKEFSDLRDVAILKNARLALNVARRYSNSNHPPEVLVGAAYTGLLEAIDTYDLSRGVQFVTHAMYRVMNYVKSEKDTLNQSISGGKETINNFKRAEEYLTQALQAKPNSLELARYLGVSEQTVLKIRAAARSVISLEEWKSYAMDYDSHIIDYYPMLKDDEANLGMLPTYTETRNLIPAPEEPSVSQRELSERIDNLLPRSLSERELLTIRLRYGLGFEPQTLEETGKVLKVTKERVRQIEAKAIRKLQQPSRSLELVAFLD